MPAEHHKILDGRVHIYRRENSRRWQCAATLSGRNHRSTTGHTNLAFAVAFAEDWYIERRADDRLLKRGVALPDLMERAAVDGPAPATAKHRRKPPSAPKTPLFEAAAEAFYAEYQVITAGERNAEYVAHKEGQLRLYLRPFFGKTPVNEITAGMVQAYRAQRLSGPIDVPAPAPKRGRGRPPKIIGRHPVGRQPRKRPAWKRPARATLHSEIVVLRQVLKYANRQGWISALPDLSAPYKSSGKVGRRAWFSPDEYKRLCAATRERAKTPLKERWRAECETFHDYVLFMANTGLRPDEASRIEYRDVQVVLDADTNERILEIAVRGKRGVGCCKSTADAVQPFLRLRKRSGGAPTALVFGKVQRELLNTVLDELDLKTDREGKPRTAYSLRHTYISMRLMEGADIYQIAKNCRTSVEMIEKHYAAHISTTLDAAAINVRKAPKPRKAASAA